MKVIFTQNVRKAGQRGDVKEVNEGYARNFLIPGKLAVEATPAALAELKKKAGEKANREEKLSKEFQAVVDKLANLTLVIKKRANDEGHLFSGITTKEICAELGVKGIHLTEKDLVLMSPIKKTGETHIPLKKAPEHFVHLTIEAE